MMRRLRLNEEQQIEEEYGVEIDDMEQMFSKNLTKSQIGDDGVTPEQQKKMSAKLRMTSKKMSLRSSEKVLKLKSFNVSNIKKKNTSFMDLEEKKELDQFNSRAQKSRKELQDKFLAQINRSFNPMQML